MSGADSLRLPLLTDEIEPAALAGAAGLRVVQGEAQPAPTLPCTPAPLDADALTERVLSRLHAQIDAALEARLREALQPTLARVGEALQCEARAQIAHALRQMVEGAVAEELAQRGER
jgi:hypothetical protein